jgi:hypothetical protein
MHSIQKRIYKTMSPEKKLAIAQSLYETARELKAAGLRVQHPDWDEDRIRARVREIFLYARS